MAVSASGCGMLLLTYSSMKATLINFVDILTYTKMFYKAKMLRLSFQQVHSAACYITVCLDLTRFFFVQSLLTDDIFCYLDYCALGF